MNFNHRCLILFCLVCCVGFSVSAQDNDDFDDFDEVFSEDSLGDPEPTGSSVSDQPDPLEGSEGGVGTPDPLQEGSAPEPTAVFEDISPEPTDVSVESDSTPSVTQETPQFESLDIEQEVLPSRVATPPNLERERYFNEVYSNYNEQPVGGDQWSEMSMERKGEVYIVQQGDTLWDISTTFFGDGGYWPKVWSLNQNITNPHVIEPMQELVFIPGNLEQEPKMQLGLEKKSEAQKRPIVRQKITIPPPQKKSTAVVSLPQSLPVLKTFVLEEKEFVAPKMRYSDIRPAKNTIEVIQYFVEALPESIGKVVEVEAGGKSAGQYQYVFVEMSGEPPKSLLVYNVQEFKNEERKVNPLAPTKGAFIGVEGQLKPMKTVNSSKNIYRMYVERAVHPVHVGSLVMPGKIEEVSTLVRKQVKSIDAAVFGGQYSVNRRIFGTAGVTFINAGAGAGLQKNDLVAFYLNPKLRNPMTKQNENLRKIGVAVLTHVTENTSTAYVINSDDAVLVGDFSGAAGLGLPDSMEDTGGFEQNSDQSVSGAEEDDFDTSFDEAPAATEDANEESEDDWGDFE